MKRAQRPRSIAVTILLGILGLLGPSMLQGAGGSQAALILQVGGVILLLIAARLVWVEVQSRRCAGAKLRSEFAPGLCRCPGGAGTAVEQWAN